MKLFSFTETSGGGQNGQKQKSAQNGHLKLSDTNVDCFVADTSAPKFDRAQKAEIGVARKDQHSLSGGGLQSWEHFSADQ